MVSRCMSEGNAGKVVLKFFRLRNGDPDICVCESNESKLVSSTLRKKKSKRDAKDIPIVDLSRDSGNFKNQASSSKHVDIYDENPKRMLETNFELKENNDECQKNSLECPVCLESMQNLEIKITPCGHLFCKDCMNFIIKKTKPNCPRCRRTFAKNSIRRVYL